MNTELILQHGLTLDEYEVIHNYLQRELTMEELGIFSAMWNAVSYTHLRAHET